jgi:demethylmenaquinone methyltransferase / 2-methoxy-6-polyprenyl-1,4-benzoquinol methylase
MSTASQPPPPDRFKPRAAREMAGMFDDVSGRYDLLNRLMTLGQDGAWRAAMWHEVGESAHVVLDLCTGSGVSLPGLVRPGRLVLGMDVSLRMLQRAADAYGQQGWAPRVVGADAFRLPLRDGATDAVTVAFGLRNLRPRSQALREIARVLAPGGTLVVLEATAPAPGPFAALHAFHLRTMIPLLGRLSDDPSAYAYLSRSVFDFGSGVEFERELLDAEFVIERRQSFLLGATRLWTARLGSAQPIEPHRMQNARSAEADRGYFTHSTAPGEAEWRWWTGAQLLTSAGLTVALGYGLSEFIKLRDRLGLEQWQRTALEVLLVGGLVGFLVRSLVMLGRFRRPPRRS